METLRRMAEEGEAPRAAELPLAPLVRRVCRQVGIPPAHLRAGSRRAPATQARTGIAYLWVEVLGHPARPLAPILGVQPQAVYQAAARGRTAPHA